MRSSAIGEDSEGASFAGQHVTILNVRHEDHVVDAVLKVRESAHTESARAYRRTLGMDEAPRVGVVVQRMIEPDCAGVMFTKNPLERRRRARHRGVVGPRRSPSSPAWSCRTTTRSTRRAACCGARPAKRTSRCAAPPDGGTVEEAVADDLVTAFCLSDEMLAEPARPGRAVRIASSARGWTSSGPSPTARSTCCSAGR